MYYKETFSDELRKISNHNTRLNIGNIWWKELQEILLNVGSSEWWKNFQEVLKAQAVNNVSYFLYEDELCKGVDSIDQVNDRVAFLKAQGLRLKEFYKSEHEIEYLVGYKISW